MICCGRLTPQKPPGEAFCGENSTLKKKSVGLVAGVVYHVLARNSYNYYCQQQQLLLLLLLLLKLSRDSPAGLETEVGLNPITVKNSVASERTRWRISAQRTLAELLD